MAHPIPEAIVRGAALAVHVGLVNDAEIRLAAEIAFAITTAMDSYLPSSLVAIQSSRYNASVMLLGFYLTP